MSLGLIISSVELGGVYAVMALGIYITYKILDFPDLTVDGSFPLGSAIAAAMLTRGCNVFLTMAAAAVVAGLLTGVIHVKFKVRDLLSGIILMTALYSVNNMISSGKANVNLTRDKTTVFSNEFVTSLFGGKNDTSAPLYFLRDYRKIIILAIILIVLKIALDFFMSSKRGYLLRAMGDNPKVVATLARNGGNIKIMGLMIANGFVALSGALYCQYISAFNLTDGTGKMVIGLASVIIGVNIFGRLRFLKSTTAVIIGSVVYTACVSIALNRFDASVKNLVTAVLFFVVLVLGQLEIKKRTKPQTGEILSKGEGK